jgi:hypothetical protein
VISPIHRPLSDNSQERNIKPAGFEPTILASKWLRSNGISSYFGAQSKKKLWPSISEITNCKKIKTIY